MKKLVLLFAVLFSVSMASCVADEGATSSSNSAASADSTSVVVESPSAAPVEEVKPSGVEDAAQPSAPAEEKKAEEATSEEPSK